MSRVGSDRARNISKSLGSGRLGSRGFQISWIGSSRVNRFTNLTGRVGSGQEFFKSHGSSQGRTRKKRVTRGSGNMNREQLSADPPGRTRASGSRIRHLKHFPLSYPKASLVPIPNKNPSVLFSNNKTPRNPYETHVRIHPYPLQPGHISLRDAKVNVELILKCRPTGRIGGSNSRVEINSLASQGDPTRMKPMPDVSVGKWRIGSGRVGSSQEALKSRRPGRVGSGQRTFKISQVGSGQINTPQNFRGSGLIS